MGTPRGIANNNPGNIIITGENWRGKVPVSQNTDGTFEQFTSMMYGVRALIKNLYSYFKSTPNITLAEISYRWNPDKNPANVEAYTSHLEERTGLKRNESVELTEENLKKITKAITEIENGYSWGIDNSIIDQAYEASGIDLPGEEKKK